MKRIYFILASLLLFVSCSFEREVRDDLYEAKISVIEENHEKLIEATTVSEVIDVLQAVKAGFQVEDARTEIATTKAEELDTASIRLSGERLTGVTNVFLKRVGTELQEMSPSVEESSQIVGLIKNIKKSNNLYKSYLGETESTGDGDSGKTEVDDGDDEFSFGSIVEILMGDSANEESGNSGLAGIDWDGFYTDENGEFDLNKCLESTGEVLKIIGIIAAFF